MAVLTPYQAPHTATGSGALSSTFTPTTNVVVTEIRLHVGVAPTTAENFTAVLNSTQGAAFDLLLISQAMGTTTDFHRIYEHAGLFIRNGDVIDFAWTNTDARTFGLEVVYRLEV